MTSKKFSSFYRRYKNGYRSMCKECGNKDAMSWAKKNAQKVKISTAAYRARHREKISPQNKIRCERWRILNPGANAKSASDWYYSNKAKAFAHSKKYMARKMKAMPKWANEFFISEAYDLAQRRTKMLGYKWSVDHIVPLRSKLVCGLHVENNLRVIPWKENLKKGNRVWPDMPEASCL